MASTYGNPSADNAISALMEDKARISIEREGKYVPAVVKVLKGCTTYQFQRGSDRTWRLAFVETYGNVEFVNGKGCDASGYVVQDRYVADELTLIYNSR